VKPARYHPAARRELRSAIEHDEEELPGRGLRLEEQITRVLLRLRRLPLSAPIWPGLDSAYDVRGAKVRRHAYVVVYMVHPDQLIILAVAHTKKQPGYWANRIDDAPPAAARRTKRKSARSRSSAATGKEVTEQTSLPKSAEDFLRIFYRGLFLLDENGASSTLSALTRAERC
jgi:toxin ParE1/3/4